MTALDTMKARVNGSVLTLTFDGKALDTTSSKPSTEHFIVKKRVVDRLFGTVTVELPVREVTLAVTKDANTQKVKKSTVTVKLRGRVAHGDEVRLDYLPERTDAEKGVAHLRDATRTQIRFTGDEKLPSFENLDVENITGDKRAPRLLRDGGLVVEGDTLTLTFDETLDAASVPAKGDFEVPVRPRDSYRCCRTIAVSDVAIAGATVVLTLAEEVAGDEVVGLSYWLSEARGGQRAFR